MRPWKQLATATATTGFAAEGGGVAAGAAARLQPGASARINPAQVNTRKPLANVWEKFILSRLRSLGQRGQRCRRAFPGQRQASSWRQS